MKELAKTILDLYFDGFVTILELEEKKLTFRIKTSKKIDSVYTHTYKEEGAFSEAQLLLDEEETVEQVLNMMLQDATRPEVNKKVSK